MQAETMRPILIAGGGIGGCASALALAQIGQKVRILEQTSSLSEIGAGIQFGPNAVRMLKRLGVLEAAIPLAIFPECSVMRDSMTGDVILRIPYGAAFEERFGMPYTLIHRADLHGVLYEACKASHLVEFETGKKVVGVEEEASGVRAISEDGRVFEGRALIGADGLWSRVRSFVIDDGNPRISGHIAYRAVLPTTQVPEHLRQSSMTVWAGEKAHLVFYPLRGGELYNLVAVFHSDRFSEGWDAYGDPEELARRFADKCQDVRTLLEKISTWRMWVLCDREPVKTWSAGNIVLVGDAAHPMLQYLGQGAGTSLEDAVCLAAEISKSGDDLPRAFQAYTERRYLRTGRVQIMARVYGEVYHASGVARELRNGMLSQQKIPELYESWSWLYDYDC